ncbi:MAG: polysaccharide deacetylase family protein [Acidiferrobacteraceae bacterium]|jgi:peptidoglycan/xylan/chitin deacetylase (PgdA/CDA1 family)
MMRELLSGILYPLTRVVERVSPGIRILMYHRVYPMESYDQLVVHPDRFAAQMQWLNEHARVISLEEAVEELSTGVRKPGVVVTFDDGYRDNLEYALPVLTRLAIPATIFITTQFCDGTLVHPRYRDERERVHLNWAEVKEMEKHPEIAIGSHTCSHPHLQRLDDGTARREIAESRRQISSRIGKPVSLFCYPSGDYGERELEYVRDAGYRAAVTVSPGRNRETTDPYALRRTEISDKDSIAQLQKKLDGAYDPIHQILDHRRRRRFAQLARHATENREARS